MIQIAPVIAVDLETIFSIVVFIIVVVSSIISQAFNKQKQGEQKPRPQQRPQPQQRPLPGKPVAGNQPAKPRAEALGDEIGEFLRRAAQGGQPQPQQAQPQRPAQAPGLPPRPARARSARPQPPVPRHQVKPIAAELVDPPRRPVGEGLAQQVQKDINTSDITRHADQLGAETRQATTKLDRQIQESFGHQVGSLGAQTAPTAQRPTAEPEQVFPTTSAAGFAAMLSDAESLKQAIIINEILQRPAHRW